MKTLEFGAASLEERKRFYEKEFDMKKVENWFEKNKIALPKICAVDAGSESRIILDKKLKGKMLYFPFHELRKKIMKYLPEDIYYDRNFYKNYKEALKKLNFENWEKQELVFDIDSDNISCGCEKLCEKCLKKSFYCGLKMKKILKEKLGFKKVEVIYSGEGFHVHVLDKKAYFLTKKERKKLTSNFKNFPIDAWVSQGSISLIRLPYSLNGLVSRISLPLIDAKTNWKDLKQKSMPKFLRG